MATPEQPSKQPSDDQPSDEQPAKPAQKQAAKPAAKQAAKPAQKQAVEKSATQATGRKNREQRRRERFGQHRTEAQGGWPASQPNPAFGKDESRTGRPDQDQTDLTGPGTGGASEPDGRTPHHEGAHPGESRG
jgi:hypothetical protein